MMATLTSIKEIARRTRISIFCYIATYFTKTTKSTVLACGELKHFLMRSSGVLYEKYSKSTRAENF